MKRRVLRCFCGGQEITFDDAMLVLKRNSEILSMSIRTNSCISICKVRFATNYYGGDFEVGTISDYEYIMNI